MTIAARLTRLVNYVVAPGAELYNVSERPSRMSANSRAPQSPLQAGIAAVQRGERERGRALLLQALEQDEHDEQAWWWLSQALETPADIQVALENVLTLNPAHAAARARLEELRAAPADPWQSMLAATGLEPEDGMDDPLQCVACGRPTQAEARKCPHCGQALCARVRVSTDSQFLRLGLLTLAILAGLALLQFSLPLIELNALSAGGQGSLDILMMVPGADLVFGRTLRLPPATAERLAVLLGVRLITLAALWVGLTQRWAIAFYATLTALAADILLNLFLLVSGWLAPLPGLVNLGLALISLYLVGAAYQEFAVVWERQLTQPDPQARSAGAFHQLGHQYSRAGLWALAVAQWRRAVGLAPKEAVYYKHLGIGYARIQRYARSLKTLEEAARRAPHDQDLPEIIALVREQAAQARPPKA